ncbi:hypothetical protein TSOC_002206 [Tetrabaena socialis]|uniref:Uncharacterized protein n=1 Tax=Tetrabaena socialis TaxID=47790 RepID=A0A2J8AEP1_9CHLO|nr:hypothetical protein TSOC_002206 [Tetrabaena socialis]|eukprot:PNH10991.1 hypothetical protein TSOC_002206 [Tetrabaena socialis]
MHTSYPLSHAAAGVGAAAQAGGGGGGGGAALHSALYGARSGAAAMHTGGTALYRTFDAAPRDKSLLASAVVDALTSPSADPMSAASGMDHMTVDAILPGGGVAVDALADAASCLAASGHQHRLNLGVVSLAAMGGAAADGQADAGLRTGGVLYGNYQQARQPILPGNGQASTLYNGRSAAAGDPLLRRYTAAQLQQLSLVRQLQLRQQQQALQQTQQAQQPPSDHQAKHQAQVLAAAAEVAQQVAARKAAAEQQQQQQQQLLLRTAAEQRLAAAATANAAGIQSAVFKRTASSSAAPPAALYKRPALGSTTADAAAAAGAGTALYGAYCGGRSAGTAAAAVAAGEVLRRVSGNVKAEARAEAAHAAAGGTCSGTSSHHMSISSADRSSDQAASSRCTEAAFLDCQEDLGADTEHDASLYTASDGCSDGSSRGVSYSNDSSGSNPTAGAYRYGSSRAAGATCARPYGAVYCPLVYSDVSSPNALALANDVMRRIRLPGRVRFMPVSTDSILYATGTTWGFSAFALALGSSYFQRLIEAIPLLNATVRHAPAYAPYICYMRGGRDEGGVPQPKEQVDAEQARAHESTLHSILFTCTYLATKVADRMPHTDMLRGILTRCYNATVSREQAYEVEAKCLEGLRYRLGPYFLENALDDEPLCCDVEAKCLEGLRYRLGPYFLENARDDEPLCCDVF